MVLRRLAGHDPGRAADLAARRSLTSATSPLESPCAAASRRADRDDIVPGDLGERLRQFLQPGDVGEAAIPDRSDRAGTRCRMSPSGAGGMARAAAGGFAASASGLRRVSATKPSCSARAQRCSKSSAEGRAPGRADRAIGGRIERAEQHVDDLVRRARVIERRDHRLDDGRGAVDRARIAPAFQRMRQRQMPLAEPRGLVGMQPGMDAVRHALRDARRNRAPPADA